MLIAILTLLRRIVRCINFSIIRVVMNIWLMHHGRVTVVAKLAAFHFLFRIHILTRMVMVRGLGGHVVHARVEAIL